MRWRRWIRGRSMASCRRWRRWWLGRRPRSWGRCGGGHARSWGRLERQQAAAAVGVRARHEQDYFALRAHRERIDRVRDPRADEHRDALALEEPFHDQRLALIAAMNLDERGAIAAVHG